MMRFVMVAMSDDDVTPPPHTPRYMLGQAGRGRQCRHIHCTCRARSVFTFLQWNHGIMELSTVFVCHDKKPPYTLCDNRTRPVFNLIRRKGKQIKREKK